MVVRAIDFDWSRWSTPAKVMPLPTVEAPTPRPPPPSQPTSPPSTTPSANQASDFGGPAGWTATGWVDRLRQLADSAATINSAIRDAAARADHASRIDAHRGEADRIEAAFRTTI